MDGEGKLDLELDGKYENSGNNYYFLVIDKIVDTNTNEIIQTGDILTFELITLTKQEVFNKRDKVVPFLLSANCSLFNNTEGTFDAILYNSVDCYQDEINRKNEKIDRLLDSIQLIKLFKIDDPKTN